VIVARGLSLLLPLLAVLAPLRAAANPFAQILDERQARLRAEAGRPEAAVAIIDLLDPWERVPPRDLWDTVSPARLEALLREAAGPRQHPLVRARAEYLLSLAADRRGQVQQAHERRAALGLITSWLVAGPFDNEGRTGFAAVHPPEQQQSVAVPPAARYEGKDRRPVGWRQFPPLSTAGYVPLDPFVKPDTNACAYAVTFVESPEARDVAVRVGSTGAVKVWVNGALALARDVYRPVHLDQDAGAARLRAGWNRVLVKSCTNGGRWGLFVRLTDRAGRPLPGLKVKADGALGARAPAAPAAAGPAPVDVGAALRERARRRPRDLAALRDWCRWLLFVVPEDPAEKQAQSVAQRAAALRPDADSYRLLALAAGDPNERRRALEQGLEAARTGGVVPPRLRASLLYSLGSIHAEGRRERRAAAAWSEALRVEPGFYPAAVRLALLAAERGLGAYAEKTLKDLAARLPDAAVIAREYASLLGRRGRRAEAEAVWKALLPDHADDLDVLRELFDSARIRGRRGEALDYIGRMEMLRPDLVHLYFDHAAVLEVADHADDATRLLEHALRLLPDDTRLLQRQGKLLMRLGRKPEALRRLWRALELQPQDAELRDYLSHQDPSRDTSLAKVHARDAAPLIAEGRKRSWRAGPTGARPSAAALLDLEVVRVHANGLSETFSQRLVLILDERGARDQEEQLVRYTPDTQSVEVRVARVHRPDGQVIEAAGREERDLSEAEYSTYYDLRGLALRMPVLKPGDVVELQYVLSDVGRRNLFADYFGAVHFLAEDLPRMRGEYVLLTPKDRPFYFNAPKLPGLERKEEVAGDVRTYRFLNRDAPAVQIEAGMPGWSEVAPYVHVSTYKSWNDVAAWYWGLVKEQLVVDDTIRAAVREAVRGAVGERARLAAVHNWVVKRTRYVALDFGIHSYKPYRTTQVLARKFGDCKDKASLLVVMLREIGVRAHLVVLRTRRSGDIGDQPASLAIFDHAIAYVPKYDLYLDGTAEFAGTGELPSQDQGVPALILFDGKGKFLRTPVAPATANHVSRSLRVQLQPDGGARVEETVRVAGQAAAEWRQHYQSPGQRRERYEKAMNSAFPGARVGSLEMPGIDDLERPVEVRGVVTAPAVARANGAARVVRLGARESELTRAYARLSQRQFDLLMGYPWELEEEFLYQLPPGWQVRGLAGPRQIASRFGAFRLTVEQRGNAVQVRYHLDINRHRFTRAEYQELRGFLVDIDATLNQGIAIAAP
jgi:cellulose synthase operon protein C